MNYTQARSFTYGIFAPRLGGRLGAAFDWGIMGLIVINIVAVWPEPVDPIAVPYGPELSDIEVGSVRGFTIESVVYVRSLPAKRAYAGPGPGGPPR